MKLAFVTDVHANLPALEAVFADIQKEGCRQIYCLGDVIGIGPFPRETVELLLSTPNIRFIMGNHDQWYALGLENRPMWMSVGEYIHTRWAHRQLGASFKGIMSRWEYQRHEVQDGVRISMIHYPLREERDGLGNPKFKKFIANPTPEVLDDLFQDILSVQHPDVLFYGHHHPFSDLQGKVRYLNPGSLGCHTEPVANYTLLEVNQGKYTVSHKRIPYDQTELFQAYEDRQVPSKEFIYRAFFLGQFDRKE
ncbi:metallophosphoesterase family protein [Deinococcus cellulosilyticus]|uniref:Metallophosphatase family protein n=1 Tax=Deinococcus cellulosilyticus (strain DSM 18568 / NBRC 106333 / KACC 11606 / 5516J-15) TaxID=1223518 RepID=A0A511N8L7_DEIC1|nr:metallophosphoesterase family protein [Deinococcus cellulosilyticus]GEM48828.1 metallophosphatase family protein [Deinococcus cellulosilyticus NBRC 106333 = KACC 11606]